MVVCSRCGRESPDDVAFCAACGAPLSAGRPREERKIVTAVFVDLVGSTTRAEQLDPEDVRALLRRYHEALRRDFERYGGTVEKFIGDAVVAIFGAPTAHEDDPERAVRAALTARETIAALNEADEALDLHVRTGIATGEALVALGALPAAGEGMVAGDVMNTAARIQGGAPVDGILVAAPTYRATERSIVYRAHPPVVAKGKAEPVEVWEAVEALARVEGLGDDARAPLVGRDHERALLLGAFARVRVEKEPQLVTLVGVPGIGKSRLVAELGDAVADDEELIYWRYGRCLPYGDGVTYWALGEVVKAQAGILENDSADAAAGKLAHAVADVLPEGERRWVEQYLRPLVGLAADEGALRDRRAETYAAWRLFLEGIADQRPLVVVFDDLQWADEGFLDFVDELPELIVGVPLLVVCSARPELLDRRSDWGGGKRNVLTVTLGPLSHTDIERLVESLLGRDPADDSLRSAVVERAAGNPLYAEEFVRMQDTAAVGALPETVLGIVSARVDLLPDDEKELLRDAAVTGAVVWSDALQAVSGRDAAEVGELLRSLERKEFLRRERRSSVAGATQHAFVHALVRDAVYAQLPRTDRATRHLRVAAWIESLPDDRREDRAEMLAHHYLEAIELSRAAGLDVGEVEPRAAAALREAGLRALALGAYPAAVRALRASAALMPAGPDAMHLRVLGVALNFVEGSGQAELEQAFEAFLEAGDREGAAVTAANLALVSWQRGEGTGEWIGRSLELLEGSEPSPDHARVIGAAARFRMLSGGAQDEAIELAKEAIAIALATGADAARASALVTLGTAYANSGEPGFRDFLDEGLALALEHDPTEVSRVYNNLGSILCDLGDLEPALATARAGLAEVERRGTRRGTGGFAVGNLVDLLAVCGEWDEADRLAADELERARRIGGLYQEGTFVNVRGQIALERVGDVESAVAAATAALEHARGTGDIQAILPALAVAAWTFARAGREADAAACVDELLALRRGAPRALIPGEWVLITALTLQRLGRSGELETLAEPRRTRWLEAALLVESCRFVDAADSLRSMGALPDEAAVRALAISELLAAGDTAAAAQQVARAREILEQLGAHARLRELDGLVAAAG